MQLERKSLAAALEGAAEKQTAQAERPEYSGLRSGTQIIRTSLASQAYALIKDALIQGQLRPGLTIAFRDVASELGMSVTPVREALMQLAAERILISAKGRTIIVPQLSPAHCLELWGIRLCLEGYCAEVAAAKAGPGLADRMESIQARIAAAKQHKDVDAGMRLNQEFHFTLYQAAEMPILTSIIEGLWAQAGAYARFFLDQHVTKRDDAAAQGPHVHSTVVRGIRTGDPTMAKQGIERDLVEIRDGILSLMEERGVIGTSASEPSARAV
jgi:DNA-binding GntR family transcriptional regulator